MAELGKATGRTEELGDSPMTSLMAVMFGWIIIVPPILSFYNTCKRQQALRNTTTPGDSGLEPGLGLILGLFIGPVADLHDPGQPEQGLVGAGRRPRWPGRPRRRCGYPRPAAPAARPVVGRSRSSTACTR